MGCPGCRRIRPDWRKDRINFTDPAVPTTLPPQRVNFTAPPLQNFDSPVGFRLQGDTKVFAGPLGAWRFPLLNMLNKSE